MAELILNPRRSPRAPCRCGARIVLALHDFIATRLVDYGPGGCQLEMPYSAARGARVWLHLVDELVARPALLTGEIAWSSQSEPWRVGVVFDDDVLTSCAARSFFDMLKAARPEARAPGRYIDCIPADAVVAPAPLPESIPCLSARELTVLRTVGAGIGVGILRMTLAERWCACTSAMFALLQRHVLVVGEPDEVSASEWAPHLALRMGAGHGVDGNAGALANLRAVASAMSRWRLWG